MGIIKGIKIEVIEAPKIDEIKPFEKPIFEFRAEKFSTFAGKDLTGDLAESGVRLKEMTITPDLKRSVGVQTHLSLSKMEKSTSVLTPLRVSSTLAIAGVITAVAKNPELVSWAADVIKGLGSWLSLVLLPAVGMVMGETGPSFKIGEKNSTNTIRQLDSINGQKISELEERMRPGRSSDAGFLGPDESLLDVLAADNDYVLSQGLTHQEIAAALVDLMQSGHSTIVSYRGRKYALSGEIFLGSQPSPFQDGIGVNTDIKIVNLTNGKSIEFSSLLISMIAKYGFYEGKGTSYRLDPRDILEVLDFLQSDSPATPREKSDVDETLTVLLKIQENVKTLQEEASPETYANLKQNLVELKEKLPRLQPGDHETVLKGLDKVWFLQNKLMSPHKASFWMLLDPGVEQKITQIFENTGEDPLQALEEIFTSLEPYQREAAGTFLLLKAIEPLFKSHPNFMNQSFAEQMEDIIII